MMTHGAMLWGAALYNNGGAFPMSNASFRGKLLERRYAAAPDHVSAADPRGNAAQGGPAISGTDSALGELGQPGNVLRIFERGGEKKPELGIPQLDERPGRPDVKLGERGLGTCNRTDPVFLGLQKTRLLDPLLNFPGTNDHPGDYRSSGCTACHVIYANDNSPEHSGSYSASVIWAYLHGRSHHPEE